MDENWPWNDPGFNLYVLDDPSRSSLWSPTSVFAISTVRCFLGGKDVTVPVKERSKLHRPWRQNVMLGLAEYAATGVKECHHCGVTQTPQWRNGPAGLKTLCNACGTRYRTVGLVPEYRPANSPTFMADQHSNSQRKITEMRRRKAAQPMDRPWPGLRE